MTLELTVLLTRMFGKHFFWWTFAMVFLFPFGYLTGALSLPLGPLDTILPSWPALPTGVGDGVAPAGDAPPPIRTRLEATLSLPLDLFATV